MKWRPDWFAIVYVVGALLVAHVADELHDSGWLLIVEAYWVFSLPLVYALGLWHAQKPCRTAVGRGKTDAHE